MPQELTPLAVIPGIPSARYLVGVDIEPVQDVVATRQREYEFLARAGHTGPLPWADRRWWPRGHMDVSSMMQGAVPLLTQFALNAVGAIPVMDHQGGVRTIAL